MADRYEELRVFVAAVDAGGVNAASDALGLAKSAVSRRISELEARLGATLVDRGERRLRPTAAGLELHRRGGELLAAWDEMEARAADRPGPRTLLIAAPATLAAHVVAPAVAAAMAGDPSRSYEIVDEGADADVTLSILTGRTPGGSRSLGRTGMLHVAAPGVSEVRRIVATQGAEAPASSRPGDLRVPSVEAAIAAAIAGAGVAAVPDYAARSAVAAGTLETVWTARGSGSIVASVSAGVAPGADALLAECERLLTP